MVEHICPRCGAGLYRTWDGGWCPRCFEDFEFDVKGPEITPLEGSILETSVVLRKPRRGTSAVESRRRYAKSPAGKAAWQRYRRSNLFKEAHKRHRQTDKYKATQARFHNKRRLWVQIYDSLEPCSCRFGLEYVGLRANWKLVFKCKRCGKLYMEGYSG